jgi:hypothetical protein
MMNKLLFTALKYILLGRNIMLKIFMYLMIFAGIIWLSIANYYYYAGQDDSFCGALISSLIILGSAACIKIYLYCSCKKRHVINDKLAALNPMVSLATSPVLNMFYTKAKNLAKENKLAGFALIGVVGLATFYTFYNMMGDRDRSKW